MEEIKSVLVATDLTEMSDEVVRTAAAFAALADAKLHVLHAFDFQSLPYAEANLPRVTFQGRIDDAERQLDEQIRRTVPAGVDVAGRDVVIYVAHRAILDSAQAVAADLIVLGPHRKRGAGLFLGSTADRVIRTATAPCLVVRGGLVRLRRVVVPLDLSRPAVGALDAALTWCAALGRSGDDRVAECRLTVLHVIPRVFGVDDLTFDRSTIGPELHRQVEAAVARVGAAAATLDVKEEVCWGDTPAEEIIRYAASGHADLVVLATHGYGAIKRALMGSVASAVARGAPCSVLLVPPALWKTEPTLDLAAIETDDAPHD